MAALPPALNKANFVFWAYFCVFTTRMPIKCCYSDRLDCKKVNVIWISHTAMSLTCCHSVSLCCCHVLVIYCTCTFMCNHWGAPCWLVALRQHHLRFPVFLMNHVVIVFCVMLTMFVHSIKLFETIVFCLVNAGVWWQHCVDYAES